MTAPADPEKLITALVEWAVALGDPSEWDQDAVKSEILGAASLLKSQAAELAALSEAAMDADLYCWGPAYSESKSGAIAARLRELSQPGRERTQAGWVLLDRLRAQTAEIAESRDRIGELHGVVARLRASMAADDSQIVALKAQLAAAETKLSVYAPIGHRLPPDWPALEQYGGCTCWWAKIQDTPTTIDPDCKRHGLAKLAAAEAEIAKLRAALDELFDGPPETWSDWYERHKHIISSEDPTP